MKNWKGFEEKQLRPDRGIVTAFAGGTEEDSAKPQSWSSVSQPRLKLSASQIQIQFLFNACSSEHE
jgi:hypothetical protein